MNRQSVIALRMQRQHLTRQADEADYISLYRDTQPGQNVYWNGFGDPPSLTYRAGFNDIEYNRERQRTHALIKGRFAGGNLGWIMPEDLGLFAAVYAKPLTKPHQRQLDLLELIENSGPMNIQRMKEETGLLVKEITPALHRLQEAFLIYEDQSDGEWDRGWIEFGEMFPDVNSNRYSRQEAIKLLLQRFAYRHVVFDRRMAKAFYKLPEKEISVAITALCDEGIMAESEHGHLLREDAGLHDTGEPPRSIFAMHRNDFLVKSNEHWLKEKYTHSYPDTLYYLLIDGEFRGVAAGKFRYTPEIEDVMPDLPAEEAKARKDEILRAVRAICGAKAPIKRYQGEEIR